MKNASWKSILRTALLAVTVCALPALAGPDNVGLGTGRDGALTVSTNNLVVNVYAQVTAPLAPGDTAITVGGATVIAAGDLVMVLQTTGIVPEPPSGGASPIDLTSNPVGRWEFARVSSVAGTTVNLSAPLLNSYAANVTQLIRVPEYTTVTINAGRSISPAAWNGATGGVVAFLANNAFTNGGSVDARGRGFRGGQPVDDPTDTTGCTGLDEPSPTGAQKGEGIAVTKYGATVTGRGRVANGGAGGVCLKSGGGGGGNGGIGGQGGNTDLSLDGNRAVGGEGGAALTFSLIDHLMLGGGGGAGHSTEVAGGAGGGIIFIRASTLLGTGSFFANGNSSSSATDAASGGGAGGSIYLRIAGAATCGTTGILATGGTGGSTGSIAIGPGGGGGGGRVLFQTGGGTCTLPATTVIGANPGTQLDPGAPGGAPYGAQPGANGSTTVLTGGFAALPPPVVSTPANGSRTNNTRPTYSGTLATPFPAGTQVVIYVDGIELARVTPDAAGNWSFTPPGAVPELSVGDHTVNALAINTAQGVQSELSGTNTFTVDVTPPTVVVTTPADGARINTTLPVYSGTISDDGPDPLTVAVTVDGTLLGNATVTGNTWTFTPAVPLLQGPHTVTATATDVAGNTANDSNAFTVDSLAPAAPVVSTPANNSTTTDNTPTYSGTAEAGSIVTVIVDGAVVGTTTATASGTWSLTPVTGLASGSHTVKARSRDAAGNISPDSNTNTFTVNANVPAAPVITAPPDNSVTNDNTPTISGTAPALSAVTLFINGIEVGTGTANAQGNWSFTPSTPLPDGPYTVFATASAPEGETSLPSNTVHFTIDTAPPDTTIVSGPSGDTQSATATFDFSSTEDGVTYECSLDGGAFTQCTDPVTFQDLTAGSHTLRVRARDGAGNVDPTPAEATWNVVLPTPVATDRDFLGDGLGCAASGGDPSALAMMGLAVLSVLVARRRRQ